MDLGSLWFGIKANLSGFEKELDAGVTKAAQRAGVKAGNELDRTLGGRLKQLRGSLSGGTVTALASGLGFGGPLGLATAGIAGFIGTLSDAGRAASDMAESTSKLTMVFPTQAEELRKWAETAATSMGLSNRAATEAIGTFGNFLQAMGQGEVQAADMSRTMVQLAADLASFNNESADDVLLALRSGLSGETEPLRRFGVDISDAAVQADLLARGVEKVGKGFTQAQKIQGRFNLIMKQTVAAQGDYSRTATGTANATRTQAAMTEQVTIKVGEMINKIQNAAISFVTGGAVAIMDAVDGIAAAFEGLQDWIDPNRVRIGEYEDALARLAKEMGHQPDVLAAFVKQTEEAEKAQKRHRAEMQEFDRVAADNLGFIGELSDEQKKAVKDWQKSADGQAVWNETIGQGTVVIEEAEDATAKARRTLNEYLSVVDLGKRTGLGYAGALAEVHARMTDLDSATLAEGFTAGLGLLGKEVNEGLFKPLAPENIEARVREMAGSYIENLTISGIKIAGAIPTVVKPIGVSLKEQMRLAAEQVRVELEGLPPLVSSTMEKVAGKKPGKFVWKERISTALKETRQGFKAALRAINHMLDNPDLGDRSRTALEKRLETLNKKAEQAKKQKNWMAYERTQQEIAKINDELDELNRREITAKINMWIDSEWKVLEGPFKGITVGAGWAGMGTLGKLFGWGENARGTSNWRGGWSVLGEEGPELVRLPSGSQVVSHERSVEMVKEANRRVDFYVHDVHGGLARAGITTAGLAAAIASDTDAQSRYEDSF